MLNSVKTQEMCIKPVLIEPYALRYVPDKTEKICFKASGEDLHMLHHVLDQYKTQEMCDAAVREHSLS